MASGSRAGAPPGEVGRGRSRLVIGLRGEGRYRGLLECVDHGILSVLLAHYLEMPAAFTKATEAFLDSVMGTPFGLPQGPGGSESLAAVYLLPIDLLLESEDFVFARYADDYFFAADSMLAARETLLRLED